MSARLWPAPSAQAAGLIARAVGAAALGVETLLIVPAAWQLRIRALGPPRPRTEPAGRAAPTCSHLG
jgi:hypothetical protein